MNDWTSKHTKPAVSVPMGQKMADLSVYIWEVHRCSYENALRAAELGGERTKTGCFAKIAASKRAVPVRTCSRSNVGKFRQSGNQNGDVLEEIGPAKRMFRKPDWNGCSMARASCLIWKHKRSISKIPIDWFSWKYGSKTGWSCSALPFSARKAISFRLWLKK